MKISQFLKTYLFIFKFVASKQIYRFLVFVICSALEAISPVVQIYLLKILTDSVVLVFEKKQSITAIVFLLLLQFILFCLSNILTTCKSLMKTKIIQQSNYSTDQQIITKVNRLPLLFFENSENCNILERVTNGIGSKSVEALFSIVDIFKTIITIIGYATLLFKLHFALPLLLLLFIVPSLFVNVKISKRKYMQGYRQTSLLRRIGYLISLFKDRAVQKELRIFGHAPFLVALWKDAFWKTASDQYELEKKNLTLNSCILISNNLISTIFIIGLIWLGRQDNMTVGDFIAYSQLLPMSISSIQLLSSNYGNLINNGLVLRDFIGFLELEEDIINDEVKPTVSGPEKHSNEILIVKNLSFRYPNRKTYALNNVSFNIKKGEKVAIIGSNGSGKSTLIKCLIGLFPIKDGTVLLNGVNINNLSHSVITKDISVLFQDYVKYEFSLKENVILSNNMSNKDQFRLNEVIHQSGLCEIIDRLENKEDTFLSPSFENGVDLSGGQWQKVALGRVFYKQSKIIILDEPTAALDPITESALIKQFLDLSEDKTAIIITHRLSNCIEVDRIIVLHDGEVAEVGNHNELLERQGTYYKMLQAQAYQLKSQSPLEVI
ncbi:ABC transporter ATP-binding protein [Fontibacillus sp. BL9]|uniref:ABC transporter ATP-binding protein n=1 Tax=Fontibacillus sp. BL9 TaxID=3389971 RepID=UPI00397DA049